MEENEEKVTKKKNHKGLKIFLVFIIILLIVFILGVAVGYYFIDTKLNKIQYEEVDETQIEVTEEVKDNLSDYRNIVLFGIDDDDGYKGRSDCIIIFSINEKTRDVKMTSIYRDTYVEVPGHGYTKINHAFAYGGATLALSTINRNLDLDITEYATINFQVVEDIVDALDGVDITVTSQEASRIPGISKAGIYTLTGKQALAYGRIRKIDSDYKRTERMRTVIDKAFSKFKKLSVTEMNEIIDEILPELHTNIKKSEITDILKDVTSYTIGDSMGWPYEVQGKMISGVWYGIPKTLKESVQKLHEDLFDETDYETTETVNNISDQIIKKTGVK